MKKLSVIIVCMVLLMFVLSACAPSTQIMEEEDEGSYSVIDDSASLDEKNSEDVFNELDNLEEKDSLDEGLNDVVDETEDDSDSMTEEIKEEVKEPVKEEIKETETVLEKDESTVTKTPSGVYKVTVNEGELVKVKLNAKDPDGDLLKFSYEKPLDQKGEWQTKMGDDGKYYTTVVVSDGENSVNVDVLIEVLSVNEDPVLNELSDIIVNEGETVKISPSATDADGDKLTFKYSGWMTSDTYKTGYDDSGKYSVTVTVSDGIGGEDSQTISVTVKDVNRAPVIEGLE